MTTDYQIKKELENEIYNCEYNAIPYAYISRKLIENTVDLIERQRAEIAKLEEYIYRCKSGEEHWVKCLLERPNEAIREFAELFKSRLRDVSRGEIGGHTYYMIGESFIDKIVKEMVCDTE